jgi:hypothetical protein
MAELQAQRTLVKSPPELWAEVSDPEALGRRLADFGEIRITTTEPESIVAWEGERASGTIELAKSGWGTKITLTAQLAPPAATPQDDPGTPQPASTTDEDEAPPEREPEPEAVVRRRFFARVAAWFRGAEEPPPTPQPTPVAETPVQAPPSEPQLEMIAAAQAPPLEFERANELLATVLDDLGAAHHRPFSRG